MIDFRFSSLEHTESDRKIPVIEGELLSDAVTRVIELSEVNLGEFKSEEVFQVLLNGMHVEKDFWTTVKLKEDDNVLIAPLLSSGQSGQYFKQIAIIAVAIVASVTAQPYAAVSFWSAVGAYSAAAAVTIAATMVLNALIPPPVQKGLGVTPDIEESQMYSITGQSNEAKKFGLVPRVCGIHRMFPNIAAQPYMELSLDPDTQKVAQYLYVIYDFGFGPLQVSDLKIGDSDIFDFKDVTYNFVDLARPETDEGIWDAPLLNDFQIYKADFELSDIGAVLDGNQGIDGIAQWQAIRSTAVNDNEEDIEIILSFVNPQGLYAAGPDGLKVNRTIAMKLEFSVKDADDYHDFNDLTYVTDFSSIGAVSEEFQQYMNLLPYDINLAGYDAVNDYEILSAMQDSLNFNPANGGKYFEDLPSSTPVYLLKIGYPNGKHSIVVKNDQVVPTGVSVYLNNSYIGKVLSVSDEFLWNGLGYLRLTLDQPMFERNVFRIRTTTATPTIGNVSTRVSPVDTNVGNKVRQNAGDSYISAGEQANPLRPDVGPVLSEFRFKPRQNKQFDIRVSRISTVSSQTSQVQDTLTWTSITTRFNRVPIVTDVRHVFLEMRIRATNQLNGVIQNLNAVCESVVEIFDGDNWSRHVSNNPAWIFVDFLLGPTNKRSIGKERIHTQSIREWASFCDELPPSPPSQTFTQKRFQTNFVLDYATTLQSLLAQIGGSCQASLNLIDGKYGVLLDTLKTIPVQVFTPRNSKDFGSMRNYAVKPDALKVTYIDPSNSWDVTEIIVYDDGFNFDNAVNFDDLTAFACTNHEQAWRFGRYMLAQNRLRQETMNITVDFEYLICTRGDYVQITQDVMKVGGTPARVLSVTGNRVVIDDGLDNIDEDLDYGYVIRTSDGSITTNTLSIVLDDTFYLDGDLPAVGDLIVIGAVDSIVFDCIVKSISPNDDLSATVVLVERADAIYTAESTDEFPEYDPQLSPTSAVSKPPREVEGLEVTDNAFFCNADSFQNYVDISWSTPAGSAVESYQVFVDSGLGYDLVATTRSTVYRFLVDPTRLDLVHSFKVIAVSATGLKLDLGAVGEVDATPEFRDTPPSNVEYLATDITGEVLQLFWPLIPDCGAKEYRIRYSPLTTGTWEQSIPLIKVDKGATTVSTQARTGTYLIKAADFNGNESAQPAAAITTIPQLFNLNAIETISDSPDFSGRRTNVELQAGSVVLKKDPMTGFYYPEGFYYFKNLLDLGQIFPVRLQSLIQAEGFTGSFISDWVTLSSIAAMSNASGVDWDVETQYRTSNVFNSIEDWVSLSDITALNEGNPENFSDWRKFVMGDATGRIFQFRLRLVSFAIDTSPRVFVADIKADMPDRIESINNVMADDTTGAVVVYSGGAFKGPGTTPNVQVSIDGASTGDTWMFDSKTLSGFTIKFFNADGDQVSRQFDALARGYGYQTDESI